MSDTSDTNPASSAETAGTGQADTGGPQPGTPPGAARVMIPVSELTTHPGNVREDLELSTEFCASIAHAGVRVPLLVTPAESGYRVIEGHRRLAAAIKAGLDAVPCDIDPGRAGDEAGQYLDMLLANSATYRRNFAPVEEATALFAAHEAGASRTELRKATGRKAEEIKTALKAARISQQTRAAAGDLTRQLSLEDLALLAEFDGDAGATSRIIDALQRGYNVEYEAEKIRQERAEARRAPAADRGAGRGRDPGHRRPPARRGPAEPAAARRRGAHPGGARGLPGPGSVLRALGHALRRPLLPQPRGTRPPLAGQSAGPAFRRGDRSGRRRGER